MLSVKKFENDYGAPINAYIDNKHNIYFKGRDIALILGCEKPNRALELHVDQKYKVEYKKISRGPQIGDTFNIQPHTIFIKEPGLYSLIFSSKLETAKVFQDWAFSKVLPLIRKYGYFKMFNNPNTSSFKIYDEYDLHIKVVHYIRRIYPDSLIIPRLGEYQDSSYKRFEAYKKGYMKGQPDIIINNRHKQFSGLCIEFKTPQCNGVLSIHQKELLERYAENRYKCLVSNDYDFIIKELNIYMQKIQHKIEPLKKEEDLGYQKNKK